MAENNFENQGLNNQNNGKGNQAQIVGAIVLAGIIIGGAILLKGSQPPSSSTPLGNNDNPSVSATRPVSKNEHIIGNVNAKVVIVEYSDTECPFCKHFHFAIAFFLKSRNNLWA